MQEKLLPTINRPHVVILGAGASKAAFPNGDKNGKTLPLMDDLVNILKLGPTLKRYNYQSDTNNFEKIYSEISSKPEFAELKMVIESAVHDYFSGFEIPEGPTLYDLLILSLREKDVIATFNWDPLLVQAYERNRHVAHSPDIRFLHGNVAIAHCPDDGAIGGPNTFCPTCNKLLIPTQLLYPIEEKDYAGNGFIKEEWESVTGKIMHSFLLTIFGYSAPVSDAEARKLLGEAWNGNSGREFLDIEIIDIVEEDVLAERWKDFIFSHHYVSHKRLHESYILKYPRRSCENMWRPIIEGKFPIELSIPDFKGLDDLQDWMQPLATEEDVKVAEDLIRLPSSNIVNRN